MGSLEIGPHSNAIIPANAPALSVDNASRAPLTFTLHTDDGELVPTTTIPDPFFVRRQLLVPDSSLVEGRAYQIQWQIHPSAPIEKSTFTAAASAPLPTTLGVVSVDASQRGEFKPCSSFNPNGVGPTALIVIHLTPDDALRPYIPLMRIEAQLEGRTIEYENPLEGTGSSPSAPGGATEVTLKTACIPLEGDARRTVRLRVGAVIAGAESRVPSEEVDIDLSCNAAPSTFASGDLGAAEAGQAVPSETTATSGCTVERTTQRGGFHAWWTFVAAMLLARVRRVPRRS